MPHDPGLAERIREALQSRRDVVEKRMFGGVAFLVRGHMVVGIVRDELMVRVGAEAHERLLQAPHARAMDFTGKPMRGFLFVAADGIAEDADLARWIEHGLAYALSLPEKGAQPPKARAAARSAAPHAKRATRAKKADASDASIAIEAYLAALPAAHRLALEKVRRHILAAAPGAEPCLSYGLPAYRVGSRPLVAVGASKKHCALYPLSGAVVDALAAELTAYETSKGTIRFDPAKPLPASLVRRVVQARLAELEG